MYFNEADRWHRRPFDIEILNYRCSESVYAATVGHRVVRFLLERRVKASRLVDGSQLPVVTFLLDTGEPVDPVLPTLQVGTHRRGVRQDAVLRQVTLL